MIDVIGNIKVDESKPERIKQFIACLRSYYFLKDDCNFILQMNKPSDVLVKMVMAELSGFPNKIVISLLEGGSSSYGIEYCSLIRDFSKYDYVLNFMEDQFMRIDEPAKLEYLLSKMKFHEADILKATFFDVEQNSIEFLRDLAMMSVINDRKFHDQYQKYYKSRYYIGCNFLTTKEFAIKFWNRDLRSNRPHPYEIAAYSDKWIHKVMFPEFELQCAIDDDHGEPGTCLMKRTDCEKWNLIWKEINDTII